MADVWWVLSKFVETEDWQFKEHRSNLDKLYYGWIESLHAVQTHEVPEEANMRRDWSRIREALARHAQRETAAREGEDVDPLDSSAMTNQEAADLIEEIHSLRWRLEDYVRGSRS